MLQFNLLIAASILISYAIRVDPDTLPSVEVLLVPPKYPFPQIREQLNVIHDRREMKEKRAEQLVLVSYTAQLNRLKASIAQMIEPVVQPLRTQWREGMYYPMALLQSEQNPHNVENVVIHVKPVPVPGTRVKSVIDAINSKRDAEEEKQLSQGVSEFRQFSQILTGCLQRSLKKYFKPQARIRPISFLQQIIRDDQNGLNPVLNLRVGSSDIGDGLLDGASYPSVVGMVEEENEMRNSAEATLLNEILYYSNQLVLESTNLIKLLLFPPSETIVPGGMSLLQIPGLSQATSSVGKLVPIPPAVARVLRKRAMKHSTVQLDITPPKMDDWTVVDVLNASLEAHEALKKSRASAYIKVKREMAKEVRAEVDKLVRLAAIKWGVYADPRNVFTD